MYDTGSIGQYQASLEGNQPEFLLIRAVSPHGEGSWFRITQAAR
jgi:hypothetical protein